MYLLSMTVCNDAFATVSPKRSYTLRSSGLTITSNACFTFPKSSDAVGDLFLSGCNSLDRLRYVFFNSPITVALETPSSS